MTKTTAAPVNTFRSFNVAPIEENIKAGNFFSLPTLTKAQIDEIDIELLAPGMMLYNLDSKCYMGYTLGDDENNSTRWNNFNTSLTYAGVGYQIGSPFAFPAGPRSVIEASLNNRDPGVVYVDTENNHVPRIFMPDTNTWENLAVAGGSGDFVDLAATNADITNLDVNTSSAFDGTFVVNSATATFGHDVEVSGQLNANIVEAGSLIVDGTTDLEGDVTVDQTLSVIEASNLLGGAVVQNLQVGGPSGAFTPYGALAGTSGTAGASGISVVLASGAGTGATCTITGSPVSGTISIHAGTSPATDGTLGTFTLYNTPFYGAMFGIMLFPNNQPAAAVNTVIYAFVSPVSDGINPAKFIIAAGNGGSLTAGSNYNWNYQIISNVAT